MPIRVWRCSTTPGRISTTSSPQVNSSLPSATCCGVSRIATAGLLQDFHRTHPEIELDVVTLDADLDAAVAGLIDGGTAAFWSGVTAIGLTITPLFDQSVFVNAAVQGVIHEALIAAVLTAMMILLFLGSWRSTLIIAASIPLALDVGIQNGQIKRGQNLLLEGIGGGFAWGAVLVKY